MTTEYDFNTAVVNGFTLYAKWTDKKYIVSFNSNGGSAVADQEIVHGGKALKPADPTKDGCDFVEWCSDAELTTEYDFDIAVTSDKQLYAKWKDKKYTVSFNSNGGSAVSDQEVVHNGKVVKPADPVKEGHDFVKWCTDAGLTTEYNFNSNVINGFTLYAQWKDSQYTVHFETYGGTAIPDQTVSYNGVAVRPATDPVKAGGDFINWYADPEFNIIYDFDTQIKADKTIYAKYDIATVPVHFDSKGGSAVPDQAVYIGNKALKPADPTYAYKSFEYWYETDDSVPFDFNTLITSEKTLYAKWSGSLKYSKSVSNNTILPVSWLDSADDLKVSLKNSDSQRAFEEPYEDTNTYFIGQMVVNTVDRSAIELPSGVSYNKISVLDISVMKYIADTETLTPVTTVLENARVEESAKPLNMQVDLTTALPDGCRLYTCDIYRLHNGVVEKIAAPDITGNKVAFKSDKFSIYAICYDFGYTVNFNSNGGSAVASQSVKSGDKVVKPADPTKAYNVFVGWYSDALLTASYNFDTPVLSNMTLYAKWKIAPVTEYHTVSFDVNGGKPSPENQIVPKYGKATKPKSPSKSGYSFVGWYKDPDLKQKYDFSNQVVADMTLYAKYSKNPVPKKDDDDKGGGDNNSSSGSSPAPAVTPAVPTVMPVAKPLTLDIIHTGVFPLFDILAIFGKHSV